MSDDKRKYVAISAVFIKTKRNYTISCVEFRLLNFLIMFKNKYIILFGSILLFAIGCKKDKILVHSSDTECRDGFLLPPSILRGGTNFYGDQIALFLISDTAQVPLKGLSRVIEGPNGFRSINGPLVIYNFSPDDEKTYRTYTVFGNCRSEMMTFTLKGYNKVVPCTPRNSNWMDIKGLKNYENLDLPIRSIVYGDNQIFINCESSTGVEKIIVGLNKNPIREGVYTLKKFPSRSTFEYDAYIHVVRSGFNDLISYNGGVLYLIENPNTKKLELSVCSAPLSMLGDTTTYPFTLKLILD